MFRQSFYSKFCFCLFLGLTWVVGSGQIISQYVETDSGTSPKGIEIWNNTSTSIDFSVDNLLIEKGTNGAAPSLDFTIDSGVLQPNEVLIVGTVDMQPAATANSSLFFEKNFTFNGDDALVLKLGSTVTDVLGTPNSDPGSSWEANGVDTRNQNIALLSGITTGELVGFSDPSTRFETINTTPSDIANGGLDGFGVAPISVGPILSVFPAIINGLNYIEGDGPSNSQSFEISGSNLDGTDVSINAPVNFAISESQTGTYGNAVTLNNFDGSATNIWVRLVSGLSFGSYSGNISINGGGASTKIVSLNGNVTGEVIVQQDFDSSTPEWNYTNDVPFFDNGWDSDGFYGIIEISSANPPLSNSNFKNNILGENDLDDEGNGTTGFATLNFENINISGYTNVQLSFDYQFIEYDGSTDKGSYEIFENDIGQGDVVLSDDSSQSSNGSISLNVNMVNEVSFNYLLNNNGQNGFSGIDNLKLTGLANDTDTDINTPATQVASGNIIVDEALNISTSVPVFKFDVADLGGDGLDTELTHVRVIPGPNNTADWSDVIEGIRLEGDGNNVSETDQNLSILDNELIIEVTTNNGEMTIAEGTSKEYTISVFIDPDFAVEGEIIQMAIDDGNDHFFVNSAGSMVSRNIMGFEGNEHSIEIEGNKLEFLVNPATTIVNEPMGTVQVAYTDNVGRVDKDFNAQVELSSTGILTGDPVAEMAVDGIANFSNLVHTALGSNLTLTASSPGETDIVSTDFNIIAIPELFITEVADPFDNFEARFIEIYNAGTSSINFENEDYYLAREANGGPSINFIQLVGNIEPKGYYIIGKQSSFNSVYGFEPDHNDSANTATVSGNGNDSYFISRDDLNDTALKNSRIDIYGVLGVNGTGENWEYEDSRAYRNNPNIKNANTTWNISEWTIEFPVNTTTSDMTPGYGDNDYIYDGAWTNIGLGNPNTTTSTTAQNIFVRSGTAILTQDTSIGDLVVRSGATLELEPNVKLTVTGDIVNEGTIIFESNDTSTAVLEAVQPNIRVVGNGFEVQRRIPVQDGFRAFRYLSSSVDTQNSAKPFVFDNWQEGGATPSGLGTHITGAMGTIGDISPDGFDSTSTGNASMYIYDPTLGLPWQSIPNTNATNFSVGDAYAILIRGDRNSPLNTNDQTGPSTTLRTTGQIRVGDFEVLNLSNTTGHFNLVGNPYQSQVDLNALLNSPNSTDVDNSVAYVWDPTLGSLGGYAVLDFSMLPITDPSTIIDYGITTPNTSDANQFLQPQQAFFVETTGPNTEITFTESIKNNNESQTTTFSLDAPNFSILDITLIGENGLTYDGLRLVYGDEFSNTIDSFDATKFWNYTDNLSILSNENYLSIEKRSIPSTGEVTPLYFGSQSLASYAFEIELSPNEEFDVYLVDQYRAQTIAIPEDTVLNYSFSVDANIPESIANDRFEFTYENTSLNTEDVTSLNFSIYPNPLKSDESLYIRSSGEIISKITSIELLNLNGQVLEVFQQSTLEPENNLTKINFKSRPVIGTYLLKITTNQNVIINKIIIK